ncbi:cell division protein FtsI (penicillin-binding protein 3) [Prevotella sp. tc2-28]|uniref:penicillin-binding protein n=1 Tax=Prevotella sp. tc2-28 TaxID=1761888 RepID=UPI00089D5C76|nr:penicillin-binding protein [Prevotella sp. tc2-28]SEA72487.1 cell division protein FtsI (penicillin-binding protein 3) [Prevotella sp. tc2-28]
MSKFDNDKVIPRYMAVSIILTLIGFAIIGKAFYTMTAKKQYWTEVADRLKRDSVSVKPNRGNILSCDGQLMATSIPEYKIFIDFQAAAFEDDSLWDEKVDSVCEGLSHIFPYTAHEFKVLLEKGKKKVNSNGTVGARHWPIYPRRIDYNTYVEVKSLPFFNMPKYKSGFHEEVFNARRRPFTTLAQRTIGGLYGAKDSAYFGLELAYDSILRGTPGITGRRKVLNKYMNIPVTLPIDGGDIVTTIDVNMQDLAERALLDELKLVNGEMGVAILMEVATGDVKAIVNMQRYHDSEGNPYYAETVNSAISYRCEPGSVFKVASFLVALDDELPIGGHKIDTSYVIHTGGGVMPMYGREMKDHNWRRGGYGDINMARTLEVSSNIGVSHVIDKIYHDQAERYVKGLHRIGIAEDLKLQNILPGYRPPLIRMPKRKKNGHYDDNWYATTLPWMSIGYETQIAPINTVTFYNAIANNGKMMRPRFVKKVVKNGEVIREFPPEVIKERIAKPKAVKTMQTILEHVVSQGLGRKAGSRLFKVAGKTGTAQVSQGKAGYKSGTVQYWLSFAGYFPADNPRYSCIVCLKKSGLPASGGGMSGVVFHHIAEGVMARNLKMSVEDARDEHSVFIPEVKDGNSKDANYVLNKLGIRKRMANDVKTKQDITPNVVGMGAKDAVYLLESHGLRVKLVGRGKVKKQSYPAGKAITENSVCILTLE